MKKILILLLVFSLNIKPTDIFKTDYTEWMDNVDKSNVSLLFFPELYLSTHNDSINEKQIVVDVGVVYDLTNIMKGIVERKRSTSQQKLYVMNIELEKVIKWKIDKIMKIAAEKQLSYIDNLQETIRKMNEEIESMLDKKQISFQNYYEFVTKLKIIDEIKLEAKKFVEKTRVMSETRYEGNNLETIMIKEDNNNERYSSMLRKLQAFKLEIGVTERMNSNSKLTMFKVLIGYNLGNLLQIKYDNLAEKTRTRWIQGSDESSIVQVLSVNDGINKFRMLSETEKEKMQKNICYLEDKKKEIEKIMTIQSYLIKMNFEIELMILKVQMEYLKNLTSTE